MLLSPVPMAMLWGTDGIMLYNDAYAAIAGARHPTILGSKVREGWPEIADFNDRAVKVGLAGGTLAFRNQELTLWRNGAPEQAWMNLDYSPLLDESGEPAGVIAIVVETTQKHHAEQELLAERGALETLNRLAAEIVSLQDRKAIVQHVVDTGVELTGAEFSAFFTNVRDDAGESYMLYTLSGAPRAAFECFPMPRNTSVFGPTFKGEGVVRADDITQDPRYGHNTPHAGMPRGHLPVRSYLAVPVMARNHSAIGGILFGHPEPGRFTSKHEAQAVPLAAHAAIAIENLLRDVLEANETLEARVEQRSAELTEAHDALRQAQKMEAVGQLICRATLAPRSMIFPTPARRSQRTAAGAPCW